MAALIDITVEQNSDNRKVLTWKTEAGALIDITGYQAKMQVRTSYNSNTAILDFSTENGGIEISGLAGQITIIVSADDLADVSTKTEYVYDLVLTDTVGKKRRFVEGAFIVSPGVTK